jgi:trk system potassium uptake protein
MIRDAYYIVVIGCGRLGAILASRLSGLGHSVVVVDRSEKAFGKLTAEFSGFTIHGNATELAVLRQAKLDKANFLLSTTDKDTVNLMVAQVAQTLFQVPMVIARVYDPAYEEIYHRLNVTVISPTQLSATAFLQRIDNPTNKEQI